MTEEEYQKERQRILDDPRYPDSLRTWMLKELNRIHQHQLKKDMIEDMLENGELEEAVRDDLED